MSSTSPLKTASVQVPNGDLLIDAYVAAPAAPGSYPGLVVLQEVFGVNAHIRAVSDRLARSGYVAIAPALYQRYAPGFEVGYSPEELEEGRKYKNQTEAALLLSDITATLAYLNTLPQVKSGGRGCIGFCFGGHVAYLAATLPEIQVTASFYGAGITTMTPGGGLPSLTRTSEIRGTVYCFFGLEDPLIPNEQVAAIEAALNHHGKSRGVQHQVFRYAQAGHGFCCDQRSDFRSEACADAWTKVEQLFQTLKE